MNEVEKQGQYWSKCGETVRVNLQTLCLKCNLGKSNLE